MTPLGAVVVGLLIAVLDLRVTGLDVLLDPLGWAIVLLALRRLPLTGRWPARVGWTAAASALLSVADVVHPVRPDGADAWPGGLQGVVQEAYAIALTVVLVLLALALRDAARAAQDVAAAAVFQRFGALLAVLGAVLIGLGWVLEVVEVPLAPALALLALALVDLVVSVCFLVVLARRRHRPWLQDVPAAVVPA